MAKRGDEQPFSVRKSAKKKPRGKPFPPGNPYRIKAGTILNPTGRPARLSESYAKWLKLVDENGVSNADKVSEVVGKQSLEGNDKAYKEMRQATEGDKVINYNLDNATDEQLERIANGEHPSTALADTSASTATPETEAGSEGDSTPAPAESVDS